MKTNIPKVIHYCWFGGNPLPPLAEKCVASWKKFFPDYEIKRWDESNFDINIIPYTKEAYEAKKYAFVSDYARFWILYNFGGLYFDTDVEVVKPMDDIIAAGPFMGCENPAVEGASPNALGIAPGLRLGVNPGLGLGVNPGLGLYREFLDMYSTLHFMNENGTLNTKTIVEYSTDLLCAKGLKNTASIQKVDDVLIYPVDYFCPMDYASGKLRLTDNTRSIHHYAKSWHGNKEILFETVSRIFGKSFAKFCSKIWKRLGH